MYVQRQQQIFHFDPCQVLSIKRNSNLDAEVINRLIKDCLKPIAQFTEPESAIQTVPRQKPLSGKLPASRIIKDLITAITEEDDLSIILIDKIRDVDDNLFIGFIQYDLLTMEILNQQEPILAAENVVRYDESFHLTKNGELFGWRMDLRIVDDNDCRRVIIGPQLWYSKAVDSVREIEIPIGKISEIYGCLVILATTGDLYMIRNVESIYNLNPYFYDILKEERNRQLDQRDLRNELLRYHKAGIVDFAVRPSEVVTLDINGVIEIINLYEARIYNPCSDSAISDKRTVQINSDFDNNKDNFPIVASLDDQGLISLILNGKSYPIEEWGDGFSFHKTKDLSRL